MAENNAHLFILQSIVVRPSQTHHDLWTCSTTVLSGDLSMLRTSCHLHISWRQRKKCLCAWRNWQGGSQRPFWRALPRLIISLQRLMLETITGSYSPLLCLLTQLSWPFKYFCSDLGLRRGKSLTLPSQICKILLYPLTVYSLKQCIEGRSFFQHPARHSVSNERKLLLRSQTTPVIEVFISDYTFY